MQQVSLDSMILTSFSFLLHNILITIIYFQDKTKLMQWDILYNKTMLIINNNKSIHNLFNLIIFLKNIANFYITNNNIFLYYILMETYLYLFFFNFIPFKKPHMHLIQDSIIKICNILFPICNYEYTNTSNFYHQVF